MTSRTGRADGEAGQVSWPRATSATGSLAGARSTAAADTASGTPTATTQPAFSSDRRSRRRRCRRRDAAASISAPEQREVRRQLGRLGRGHPPAQLGRRGHRLAVRAASRGPPHLQRERLERPRDLQARGVMAAVQAAGDLVVGELLDDPQLERAPLVERAARRPRAAARAQRAGRDALVDGVVVLRALPVERAGRAGRGRPSRSGCACGTGAGGCGRCRTATGAPEPSARSLKRRSMRHAWAKVSAVRSSAAASEPVWRWNHARIQTA